jgi:hypothetical protein
MKTILLSTLLGLAASSASFATSIQYDTTVGSVFNCSPVVGMMTGCGTAQVTVGDTVVLTYVPAVTSADVTLPTYPSTNVQFGTVVVSCLDGTMTCAMQSIPLNSLTLTLNITQVSPDGGLVGAIPDARIFGAIGGSSSAALMQWNSGSSVSLTGPTLTDIYSIQNLSLGLVAPTTGGTTTIQAQLQAQAVSNFGTPTPVPEPAISLLLAGGLLAAGTVGRKRRRS